MKLKAKENINFDFEEYGIDFIKDNVYQVFRDGYIETENGSSICLSNEEIEKYFEII